MGLRNGIKSLWTDKNVFYILVPDIYSNWLCNLKRQSQLLVLGRSVRKCILELNQCHHYKRGSQYHIICFEEYVIKNRINIIRLREFRMYECLNFYLLRGKNNIVYCPEGLIFTYKNR
jgi:hypothetical protein